MLGKRFEWSEQSHRCGLGLYVWREKLIFLHTSPELSLVSLDVKGTENARDQHVYVL